MSVIGVIWVVLIVLKWFGLALATTSWWIVVFWPLLAILVLWLVGLILGVGLLALK